MDLKMIFYKKKVTHRVKKRRRWF